MHNIVMDSSKSHQLHFILFPFMAQGHMIPMIDIAILLANNGLIVTIVTTPLNANRFMKTISRAIESGLKIQFVQLEFPRQESGLPNGCENIDMLPSLGLSNKFFLATNKLQESVEKLLQDLNPKPNCIISDVCLPYTSNIASNLGVPRISFSGSSCFCMLCAHSIKKSMEMIESVKSDSEYFVLPGLPDRIELTKNQLPGAGIHIIDEFQQQVGVAEEFTYGIIINSFEELEAEYVKEYKKIKGDNKVWCIGPVSLCNQENLDKVHRGDKASIEESDCLKWLDLQNKESVIYVCFGSLCNLLTSQLIELGLGLEATKKPFIWVIRGGQNSKELYKWIQGNGFEERIKERGLIIRGWAPQVAILSHQAIGGFLTHCGWNSTIEGITSGKPMVTWPLFADQFCNERLVVDVLKIGVKVGAEVTVKWGEEEKIGVSVTREEVRRAIDKLMEDGKESEERRKRSKELSIMAKKSMEENGSSYFNIKLLIQDIRLKMNVE